MNLTIQYEKKSAPPGRSYPASISESSILCKMTLLDKTNTFLKARIHIPKTKNPELENLQVRNLFLSALI